MKKARMLGSYAGHLAKQRGNSVSHLSQLLSCTETQVQAFFKGRAFPSYNQLSALAKALGTTPKRLIAGDEQSYNATVSWISSCVIQSLSRQPLEHLSLQGISTVRGECDAHVYQCFGFVGG